MALEPCPNCGERIATDAAACFACRWRRPAPAAARPAPQDPLAQSPAPDDPFGPVQTPAAAAAAVLHPVHDRAPDEAEPLLFETGFEPQPMPLRPPEPDYLYEPMLTPVTSPARPVDPARRVLVALASLAIASAVAGFGLRLATRPTPEGPRLLALAQVGPEGAVVPFDRGATLTIPEGALTEVRTIAVRRVPADTADRIREALGEGVVGPYRFEPAGQRFERPVTIVMPMPRTDRGSHVLLVHGAAARKVPASADTGANTVTITTRSFSFPEDEP